MQPNYHQRSLFLNPVALSPILHLPNPTHKTLPCSYDLWMIAGQWVLWSESQYTCTFPPLTPPPPRNYSYPTPEIPHKQVCCRGQRRKSAGCEILFALSNISWNPLHSSETYYSLIQGTIIRNCNQDQQGRNQIMEWKWHQGEHISIYTPRCSKPQHSETIQIHLNALRQTTKYTVEYGEGNVHTALAYLVKAERGCFQWKLSWIRPDSAQKVFLQRQTNLMIRIQSLTIELEMMSSLTLAITWPLGSTKSKHLKGRM